MFGLPLYSELIQGSALRTWDCVTQIVAFIWYKFASLRQPITMPRSRRRHHSRSRSRSRSHSHDRDREPKRRKIESYESPHHRRSVSSEPEANQNGDDQLQKQDIRESVPPTVEEVAGAMETGGEDSNGAPGDDTAKDCDEELSENLDDDDDEEEEEKKGESMDDEEEAGEKNDDEEASEKNDDEDGGKKSVISRTITPKKPLTPKQVQKRLESEKKRMEKQKEREERERKKQEEKEEREKKRQEEKDEKKRAKEQQRLEKEKQALKEKEAKQKEKEMREAKRKEKEEKEEQKRKEKEVEKLRKQQEIDEKNKEKLKVEEQKQKAAAVFANFFVTKKQEGDDRKKDVETTSSFMPFEVKSDMRLAPVIRRNLPETAKENLVDALEKQESADLYLAELKRGKAIGKDGKTWLYEDGADDVTILDDLGESIVEQKSRMRAKFLKFHENQRPAYYGTWRKSSKSITPRKPLNQDTEVFNYEVDSDDEWEDEEDGEDIVGSDEEDKENESENDNDYEVDNDVFVPHGHLSDDEGEKDDDEVFNPEAQKAKMKLLNSQFLEERKSKTSRIKPRVIGCIWQDNNKKEDDALLHYLQPFSIITNNIPIIIRKRSENSLLNRKTYQGLEKEYIPDFLKLLHGNTCKKKMGIVDEYLQTLNKKNLSVTVHKYGIVKQLKQCAQWMKCPEEGPMFKVPCWYVSEDVQREYSVKLQLPKKE